VLIKVSKLIAWLAIFCQSYAKYLSFLTVDWVRQEGDYPTVDQFAAVYDLPEEDDKDYGYQKRFLTWFANNWLVKAAGYEHYGPTVRPYKMAVNTKVVDGKRVNYVTKESEAYARLMFENCRDKWMHITKQKLKNPKWVIPTLNKDDDSTHKYHTTKYSDKSCGQVKGGGWSPEAFAALTKHIKDVKAFREQDKVDGWKIHKLCKELIRVEMDITDDKFLDNKRKRNKARAPRPTYIDVEELSDVYSDGSEDEGGA
jgi:hypothetical protein